MPDYIAASTTDTEEDVKHSISDNWRQPAEAEGKEPPTSEKVDAPGEQKAEPEAKPEPAPKPESKSAAQKRYDALTRRIKDLESRLEAASTEPEVETEAVSEPFQPTKVKPTLAEFNFDNEKYIEALTDWKIEQREAEQTFKQQQLAERQRQNEISASWGKQLAASRSKHADWDEVVGQPGVIVHPNPDVVQSMRELANGSEVAYYLGTNLDVIEKLRDMTPARAMFELGRISVELGSGAEVNETPDTEPEEAPKPAKVDVPAKRAVSNAPAPIKPVGGSATKSSIDLGEADYQTYRRIRDQQVKNRYRR